MAGSKSTQTRFVGIITFIIHPYACFSRLSCMHALIDVNLFVLSPSVSVLDLHAGENIPYGYGQSALIAPHAYRYSNTKRRDV